MNQELITSANNNIELYYNNVCREYGASCKLLTCNKYTFSEKKEQYLVLGLNGVPDDLDVKDIYVRNERSNSLFYTDYFVVKFDENAGKLEIAASAISYLKTAEFLKKLFDEFQTPLPPVIRGDEIGALKEFNSGRNNSSLPREARARFERGLAKFFKEEKSRSKYLKKWRDFYRSDKFDRKASRFKMFRDFARRNSQIISSDLLHETNDDLKTTVINEHEFLRFKEIMQNLYPEVLYSVSDLEVQNEGFDKSRNKNKPIHKIKTGPFGKLITYEAFCEEREKKFATEGFDALKNLKPAYYETRQLTYKEIDEPFVASVLNTIRFAYAKGDSLQTVRIPGIDVVSFIDVPVDDMMNFVSLAKANKVSFYLDCFGKFGKPNFDKIRVVYSSTKDDTMNNIVSRMITEKFELSHISTSSQRKSPPLDKKINQAKHIQVTDLDKLDSPNKKHTIEL